MTYSVTVPAPTGGWNARDPLDAMRADDAVELLNYFPEPGFVRLRNGYRQHARVPDEGGTYYPVESLFEFPKVDGTTKFIAAAGTKIYDASTYGGTPSSLGTGYTSARWQGFNFRDTGGSKLILLNGADTPQVYNGSTIAGITFTVITTPANLIQGTSHKARMYLVEKDTSKVWYGATNASSGALSPFDVGTLLLKGGFVQAVGTYTRGSGDTTDDLLVIISSKGEILTYTGSDPGTDFALAGRYYIAPPVSGRRITINTGSDLYIISQIGLVALSNVLASVTSENKYNTLSNKIGNVFEQYTLNYGNSFGWQAIIDERGNSLYVNVPFPQQIQIVQNTATQAWTKYTGMNSLCWSMYVDYPYFGTTGGYIYQANYGTTDNGQFIPTLLKTAFNYVGSRGKIKKFTMLKPLTKLSSTGVSFIGNVNTDFKDKTISSVIQSIGADGSPWDTSPWDISPWGGGSTYVSNWYSVTGIGRCASIVLKGDFKNTIIEINAFHLNFVPGGVL